MLWVTPVWLYDFSDQLDAGTLAVQVLGAFARFTENATNVLAYCDADSRDHLERALASRVAVDAAADTRSP